MKTLQQLKKLEEKLVQQIESEQREEQKTGSAYKKHKPTLVFYRLCINYLSTNPSLEYLEKEYSRLSNRLKLIINGEPLRLDNPYQKKIVANYHKESNTASIKSQVKALKFLLED